MASSITALPRRLKESQNFALGESTSSTNSSPIITSANVLTVLQT